MPIDKSLMTEYFEGKRTHFFYKKSVEKAEAFLPHAEGTYPEALIGDRRPNEPLEVQEYRKKIWKPKTKPTFGRIISSLGKIRRSADWSINWPEVEFPRIREGQTLEDYCDKNFPYLDSVTNWAFAVLLKKYLIDPNAVCLMLPLTFEVADTDFREPYPFLYGAAEVIDFVPDDYVLIRNPQGAIYYTEKGKMKEGRSFFYIDTVNVERWDQINTKGDMKVAVSYAHNLPEVPFRKLGAIIENAEGFNHLHASRIEDILPELDEAVREYSDLQAGVVGHAYAERWEYSQNECPKCKGQLTMPNPRWNDNCDCPKTVDCDRCHGKGYVATGPYSKVIIRPMNNAIEGQANVPTPPIGYVKKDIDILNYLRDSVKIHIYDGLAAINFQFLEQAPLNQSGTAKEVDKDEFNNTVHAIAEDIVNIVDWV